MADLSSCDGGVIELKCFDLVFLLVIPEDHLAFTTCRHHEEIVPPIELESIHWEEEAMVTTTTLLILFHLYVCLWLLCTL